MKEADPSRKSSSDQAVDSVTPPAAAGMELVVVGKGSGGAEAVQPRLPPNQDPKRSAMVDKNSTNGGRKSSSGVKTN